jgi:hypothetical protein
VKGVFIVSDTDNKKQRNSKTEAGAANIARISNFTQRNNIQLGFAKTTDDEDQARAAARALRSKASHFWTQQRPKGLRHRSFESGLGFAALVINAAITSSKKENRKRLRKNRFTVSSG